MKPQISLQILLYLSSQRLTAATSDSQPREWPHNLPSDTKYFPEDEAAIRKYASIHKRLAQEPPQAVRKMSPDDGQMFFLDYWGFTNNPDNHRPTLSNISTQSHHIQPAILPIYSDDRIEARFLPRVFAKRDFQCPSDTSSCSSIGRSDACCPSGLTCNVVTGGQVGCCQGSECAGQVAACPADYTTCEAFGGGCCVPGYACASGGCIKTATETIVVTPTHSSTPSPTSSTSTSSPPTTTTSPPPTTSSTTSSTSTSSASTCSSGYNSCAASLGGGCCPDSMVCGSSTSCISPSTSTSTSSPSPTSTTTSVAIVAPARPTSNESPATITGTSCPTGFYQCSAYYNAGSCCQVGRDCGMTSCPPSNPSTVLQSDGVTVVVGNGGSVATVTNNAGGGEGACATGWFSCAASVGGNCCPSGFNCGTASCYMNGTTGAAETGKRDAEKNEGPGGRVKDVGVGVLRAFGVVLGTIVIGLFL